MSHFNTSFISNGDYYRFNDEPGDEWLIAAFVIIVVVTGTVPL